MNFSTDDEFSCTSINDSLWNLDTEGFNQYLRPIVIFYEILVFIVSFLWNLYVIIFIIRRKKMLSEPPNIFFLNLAIADFLATAVCIPFYFITVITREWTFGNDDCTRRGFCKAVGFFLSTFLLVSVYFLAAVAFDRFIAIVRNWQYEKLMSVKRAWIIVALCWFTSVLVASPPLYGFGIFFFEHRLGACLFRWSQNREYVLFFAIQLLIPIVVIAVCTLATYCSIRKFLLKQHQRTIRHMERQATVRFQEKHRIKQRNIVWLFTALLIVLSVCWACPIITALIGFFIGYEKIPGPVFVIDLMFVLTNIMANPIVHAFFRKAIRQSIIDFFYSLCHSIMSCFKMNNKKDFKDNVTSYLREAREVASSSGSSSDSNSNRLSTENVPTLISYVKEGSTDDLLNRRTELSSTIGTDGAKYPGVKRKVSIIELQEMEDRNRESAENAADQLNKLDVVVDLHHTGDGEPTPPNDTFMHIL